MGLVFNEGLEAKDFKYYIASGRSLEQLTTYEADMFQFALDTQRYVQRVHANRAEISERRLKTEVLGLRFNTHAAPAGWQDGVLGTKVPVRGMGILKNDFDSLWVNHAHMYLGAMPRNEGQDKPRAPVVMPLQDKWIIACPVFDDKAFVPQDAIEIDPAIYATLTNQDPSALRSPATDPAYQSDFLKNFPFVPKVNAAPAASLA